MPIKQAEADRSSEEISKPRTLPGSTATCYSMPMAEAESGNLTIVEEAGGFRHHLDGVPIHAGEVLEFFNDERNSWIPARFELVFGLRGRQAVMHVPDGSYLPVGNSIRLRWPVPR